MVKVATTVDGPMKLLWAKSGGRYTMLGLGDVVIPGTFVARGLRYDAEKGLGGRPYFHGCLIGYVIGLGVTMGVMSVSGRAQPALLYLRWVAALFAGAQINRRQSCVHAGICGGSQAAGRSRRGME